MFSKKRNVVVDLNLTFFSSMLRLLQEPYPLEEASLKSILRLGFAVGFFGKYAADSTY